MQLVLPWLTPAPRAPRAPAAPSVLQVGSHTYPITVVRHRRARRYVLRMTEDGGLRLTVPRGASVSGGLAFAKSQGRWIAREHARREGRRDDWVTGTRIWFRGVQVPLTVRGESVSFAAETTATPRTGVAVRAVVEGYLRDLAVAELTARCLDLARLHGLAVTRVSVRNQQTRWGSCSSRGTVALNWRLIQMPPDVSDYVILHELMHVKQPNHSRQFWREVAAVCDGWREAERWLRQHGRELLP